jgi:ribonuclease BN (tRNA processing enzyme)
MPSAKRFHASLLLRQGNSKFLFDAGEPCAQRLREIGVRCSEISHVFLSHAHADHVSGLPLLIQCCEGEKRKLPLTIVTPQSLISPFMVWLDAIGLGTKKLGFQLHFQKLERTSRFEVGDWKVKPFPTSHAAPVKEESFGFVAEINGTRIVYSGDLGSVSDLEPVIRSADLVELLLVETSHIELEDLVTFLQERKINCLALLHLSEVQFQNSPGVLKYFEQNLPGIDEILVARDGEHLEF